MAFNDLTPRQRGLVTAAIEVLKSADYQEDFLWKCGRSKGVEFEWVLEFTETSGSKERIPGDFQRTDLYALRDLGYLTVIEGGHPDRFTCALTRKAYEQHKLVKQASASTRIGELSVWWESLGRANQIAVIGVVVSGVLAIVGILISVVA